VERSQQPLERQPRRTDLFAFHAAAGIEDDAEADRDGVRAAKRHALDYVVLVDDEVFFLQSWHEAPARIRDRGGDIDQLHGALELETLSLSCRRFRRPLRIQG